MKTKRAYAKELLETLNELQKLADTTQQDYQLVTESIVSRIMDESYIAGYMADKKKKRNAT